MSDERVNPESRAVQAHLMMTQDIIRRMAENSRSCKTWCIATTLGVLLAAAILEVRSCAPIAMFPAVPLMMLDAYYLSLERSFRDEHGSFIGKLHSDQLTTAEIYGHRHERDSLKGTLRAIGSISVLGFYVPMAALMGIMGWMLKAA